jgi:hypothetical protein
MYNEHGCRAMPAQRNFPLRREARIRGGAAAGSARLGPGFGPASFRAAPRLR